MKSKQVGIFIIIIIVIIIIIILTTCSNGNNSTIGGVRAKEIEDSFINNFPKQEINHIEDAEPHTINFRFDGTGSMRGYFNRLIKTNLFADYISSLKFLTENKEISILYSKKGYNESRKINWNQFKDSLFNKENIEIPLFLENVLEARDDVKDQINILFTELQLNKEIDYVKLQNVFSNIISEGMFLKIYSAEAEFRGTKFYDLDILRRRFSKTKAYNDSSITTPIYAIVVTEKKFEKTVEKIFEKNKKQSLWSKENSFLTSKFYETDLKIDKRAVEKKYELTIRPNFDKSLNSFKFIINNDVQQFLDSLVIELTNEGFSYWNNISSEDILIELYSYHDKEFEVGKYKKTSKVKINTLEIVDNNKLLINLDFDQIEHPTFYKISIISVTTPKWVDKFSCKYTEKDQKIIDTHTFLLKSTLTDLLSEKVIKDNNLLSESFIFIDINE